MKNTKKILAVALSVLLILSVMPFAAFAADVDSYQSLVDEVAAFNAGDADVTITLTADVELQNTITIDTANGKTLTINGGKNITLASGVGSAFYVKQGSLNLGKNTITGAPTNYKLIYLTGSTNPQDANYSNVTIAGATINCTNGYAVMISANGNAAYGANITTKSGTVYGYYGALYVNGSIKANVGENIANVTVSGGTLTSTEDEGTAIYGAGYANYTIKSGTLTAATAAYFKAGNVTISGGTFNATGAQKAYSPNGNGYEPTGEAVVLEANSGYAPVTSVSIKGGTFNSANADPIGTYANNTSVTAPDNFISGGTFKSAGVAADVSEYLVTDAATDKVVDSNGKVVDALFEVNGVKYGHITDAVAAVPTNGTQTTVKLLKDVSDSGYGGAVVKEGQNVIFDLDDNTWTLRGTVGSTGTKTNGFQFLKGSTVTIKDGTINASLASIYTVIQNYGDLTIDRATINANYSQVNRTTVSSNNGSVTIKDSTIYMKSTQPTSQAISLTPGWAANYKDATMVVENSTITGAVAVDSQAADSTAELEFKGTTTLDGDIRVPEEATGEFTVKNSGTGVEAPEGYKWDDNGVLTELQDTTVAVIGSTEYTTLEAAIAAVQDGETIKLVSDVNVAATIVINDGKNFTIDTNGKTISSTVRVFEIRNGGVTLTGNGTLETTAVSAVAVYGSADSSAADYATFTLGEDATISAPSGYGAMIGANNKAAYGAKLTIDGTINSLYGVYTNGNIQEPADKTNAAQVTINGTVNAGSEDAAVYAAGYAKWTVNEDATIAGGSGIYIKSGDLAVNGGTITATGAKTAYVFNTNGANGTGDAIIIDSCGYPGNVPTVAINGGTISSTSGDAVASYTKQDDPRYSDATFERVDEVIPATSTAVFSSDVSALAEDGYKTVYDEAKGGYVVAEAVPTATVTQLPSAQITNVATTDGKIITFDKGYKFVADDDATSVQESAYKTYSADYVITSDTALPAGSVTLGGQYNDNDPAWVTLTNAEAIPANTEVRLLQTLLGESVYTYEDICTLVREFNCAIKTNDASVAGADITVELRIYETEYDAETGTYTEKAGAEPIAIDDVVYELETPKVAQIGDVRYETLAEAFAAAQDGQTITVLADSTGNGIKVPQGKFATGLTVDFGGHTYTVNANTVGSTGTETNGFQLLKDNKITFQNGTIYSTEAKILVQNYSDLTLDNMELTLNKAGYASAYTLSNNNGNIVIDDTTINANPAGGFAFDVCRYASYPSVSVTVTGDSVINGDVEIFASKGDPKEGLSLNLNGGTMSGDIVVDSTVAAIIENENVEVKKAAGFVKEAPEGFEWNEDGILVPAAEPVNGGSLTLDDGVKFNAYLDADAYGVNVNEAIVKITYNANSDLNDKTVNIVTETKALSEVEKYVDETSPYNGTYKFTLAQAPAQMNEDIVIELYANADETGPVASITTSAAELCEAVIASEETSQDYKDLCASLLDYGRAAQIYFSYDLENLAAAYNNAQVTTLGYGDMRTTAATLNGVPFQGVSFTVLSTAEWNIIVKEAQTVDTISGVPGASASATVLYDQSQAIKVTGIDAADFAKAFTVYTNSGNVTLSAAMIVRAIVKTSTNTNYQDLARAFYLYGVQAESFFAA